MSDPNPRAPGLISKTLAGLRWAYLSVAARLILSFLFVAILARLLAPIDFGLFGIVLIFVGLVEMVGRLAIGPAVVQRLDLTDRHVQTGFSLVLAIGVILAAMLWLLAPSIGWFFDESVLPRLLRTLAVVMIINSIGVMPEHLLRRDLRFKNLALADILSETVGYGLTALVLASHGFGVWALAMGTIMRRAVHVAVVLMYSPPSWHIRFSLREAKELLHYGSALSLVGFFNFIAQRGGYFIIGRWLGSTSLGYYTQSYRLVSAPFEAVSLTLLNVLFPAMSARQQQLDRLQIVYLSGVEMLALLVVPASILVCVSAPELVVVVLGGQWGAIAPIVQVLAIALPFQICGALNVPPIRALGGVYREAWRQAIWALVVVSGVYFGSRWGLSGVASSVVVASVMIQFFMTQLALSLLKLDWSCLLRCYVPALWAGVWSGLAALAVSKLAHSVSLPVFFVLGLESLALFAVALVAVYVAPLFAWPVYSEWILAHIHFEALGLPGYCLRNGLAKLLHVGQAATK